jgi:hypothetical protein
MTRTRTPYRTSRLATIKPAGPAPTTKTSVFTIAFPFYLVTDSGIQLHVNLTGIFLIAAASWLMVVALSQPTLRSWPGMILVCQALGVGGVGRAVARACPRAGVGGGATEVGVRDGAGRAANQASSRCRCRRVWPMSRMRGSRLSRIGVHDVRSRWTTLVIQCGPSSGGGRGPPPPKVTECHLGSRRCGGSRIRLARGVRRRDGRVPLMRKVPLTSENEGVQSLMFTGIMVRQLRWWAAG